MFQMSNFAAITEVSCFRNCPIAQSVKFVMFIYDIFNTNNIAKILIVYRLWILSLASTF